MNALLKNFKMCFLLFLLCFASISLLYAQASGETQKEQQYEELVKFQTKHIIEQDKNGQALSEIMTGISMQTPKDVFLAELAVTTDPSNLKEAVVHEPLDENLPVGEFEFVEYDDLFAGGDDGSGSGFGIGVSAGHCPPGERY